MNISIKFVHNKPVLSLPYNGNIKGFRTKICQAMKAKTLHSLYVKHTVKRKNIQPCKNMIVFDLSPFCVITLNGTRHIEFSTVTDWENLESVLL